MIDGVSTWLSAVATAVATTAAGAVARLFRRVADNDARLQVLEGQSESGGGAAFNGLRRDFQNLQLSLERNFVRRDEWVPTMSRIEGMLERQGESLIRLEERQKRAGDEVDR